MKKYIIKFKELSLRDRTSLFNRTSMIGNFIMAGGKIILGIFTSSIFFFISMLYSLGVAYAKMIYLNGVKNSNFEFKKEKPYYLRMSIVLLMTSIIYIIYMIRLYFYPSNFNYGMVPALIIAFISFTELALAIRGLLKSNKSKDFLVSGMKCINISSALISIVLTQVAILSFTAEDFDPSPYNALGGIIFGGICVVISIVMLIIYCLKSRNYVEKG